MELDKDLQARQEARRLAALAERAQEELAKMSQQQLDRITETVARAFVQAAPELASMAVRETGFGNVEDKITKNEFAAKGVLEAIRDIKTVGVLTQHPGEKLWEIGVPVGVIAGIIPSTNPTSTVCYKALIALKAGNSIVFSPHPKAILCTLRATEIVARAAEVAGALLPLVLIYFIFLRPFGNKNVISPYIIPHFSAIARKCVQIIRPARPAAHAKQIPFPSPIRF